MNIGELTAHIDIENNKALRKLADTSQAFTLLDKSLTSALNPIQGLLSISNIPLLTSGVDAIWSMTGAIGTVPAVAGAAGLAIGTMKVATAGLGDAMKVIGDDKKFSEQLRFMAPAMQDALRSVQKLVPGWDTLKKRVQDAAWSNFNTHIDLLGKKYLPVLNTGMFKTAMGLNRGATGVAQFLEESSSVDDVSHSFDGMSGFVEKVASAFPNLIKMILDFVTVGSDFLPRMGDGFVSLIQRMTDFIDKARETGQLHDWIQRGIDSVKQFGQILFNVGAILVNVFKASGQEGSGLLGTLLRLTEQMLAWTKSAEGQEQIGAVFQALSQVALPLTTIIPMIVQAVIMAAQAFNALPGPVQSVIGSFLGWAGIIGFVISRIGPLLALLNVFKFKAVATAATWIASQMGIVAATGASTASIIGMIIKTAAVWVAQWIKMAAQSIASVAVMVAQMAMWVARTVAGTAIAIAALVAGAVAYVAQWAIMAAGAMASAVVMAAAWFVALGPIGWVIAAIVGLVALIIMNWDTVKRVTIEIFTAIGNFLKAVWEWIKQFIQDAVNRVVAIFNFLSKLRDMALNFFGAMKDAAIGKVMELVNWIKGIPGTILGALGDLGHLLWDAGRRIIQGLIDGIKAMIGAVGSAIGSVASTIRGALPFSPAKWGPLSGSGSPELAGQKIGQMLADGIRRSVDDVSAATIQMTSQASPQVALANFLGTLPIKQDIIDGITTAIKTIKIEIDGAGVAKISNNANLFNSRRRIV